MHYSLCDMIADITQNSVEAGASKITVDCIQNPQSLNVTITDNGSGMSKATLERAKDPFYTDGTKHVGRKVGLGIPFLIQTAEETEGACDIQSTPGKGTTVFTRFNLENIDTPPVGNISNLFFGIITFPGDFDMDIHRADEHRHLEYRLNKNEIKDALEGDLESAASLTLLKQFLDSKEQGGSV
ncbi:MAG: ATP-binding protein [Treponema sp.]|jgi:hypothetical protein|nr:ATP-binding protein [Treponema sp.]